MGSTENLPFEIKEQIVQCFGTAFHYRDTMESFLRSAGVDAEIANRHRDHPKFVWARYLLRDLEQTENGYLLQRRILTDLCKLKGLPDKAAPNPDAGLDALRKLKSLAVEHDLVIEGEKRNAKGRRADAEQRAKIRHERAQKLTELRKEFYESMSSRNRQAAGYSLEDILAELFPLFDIEYRKSYKTNTEQIDGHFRFEGFDYIVEARWREGQPNEQEIGGFKQKVDTKLDATRGIFISINGFRPEVVARFQGGRSSILFVDGEDLIHILEGRIHLHDALRWKIEKAAQEGVVFVPVRTMIDA